MLTTSTPETVNPVSDAAEAAGVPVHLDGRALGGLVLRPPGQARRARRPSSGRTTSASASRSSPSAYTHLWPQVPTNKKVGVMWPNDADGNAIRAALGPLLKKAGYTIVDPGAYADGTNDYSAQIAQVQGAELRDLQHLPDPARLRHVLASRPRSRATSRRSRRSPRPGCSRRRSRRSARIGDGLASGVYWAPTWPYTSSLTGISLARTSRPATRRASGKEWNQQAGASLALFDVADRRAQGERQSQGQAGGRDRDEDPRGRHAARARSRGATGPIANVVATPIIGGQWVATPGTAVSDRLRDLRELERPQRPCGGEADRLQLTTGAYRRADVDPLLEAGGIAQAVRRARGARRR